MWDPQTTLSALLRMVYKIDFTKDEYFNIFNSYETTYHI